MNDSPESLGLSDWSKIEVILDKAIDSPASITQEEKHKIAEWIPSREEMESRVQKHLSRSLNDLFHHAATDRDSLTYLDCVMIHQGFHLFDKLTQAGRDIQRRHRENQQPELYAKWERARATVLSELELRAVLNVTDPEFYRQKQAGYLTPRLKEHERTRGRPAEWVHRIIDQGGDKTWGFRIYCSFLDDSPEWNYFHQQFHRIVDDLPLMELGNEEIRDSKHTELINFDGREDDIGRLRQ